MVSCFDRFNLCEGDTFGLLCAHWMKSDDASTTAALNLGSVYLQLGVSACNAFLSSLSGIEHQDGSGGRTSLNRLRSILRRPFTISSSELKGLKTHTPFSSCPQVRCAIQIPPFWWHRGIRLGCSSMGRSPSVDVDAQMTQRRFLRGLSFGFSARRLAAAVVATYLHRFSGEEDCSFSLAGSCLRLRDMVKAERG